MLADFHFLRPYWFIALLPLIGFFIWDIRNRHSVSNWKNVCDPALLSYLLRGKNKSKKYLEAILIGLVLFFMIIALAGPTWKKLPKPVILESSALVILMDLSLSMLTEDIKPSRLQHAKFKISDLLDLRKGGQTALVVYAGDAFTVVPLTDDIKTIKSLLSSLSPEIMPSLGSNTGVAISQAIKLLEQGGFSKGNILIISDEIDEKYAHSFKKAKNYGYRISILGIGTKEGAPVKLSKGDFLRDLNDVIVIPKLNNFIMDELAVSGGGIYVTSVVVNSDIELLNNFFTNDFINNNEYKSSFDVESWHEFGPWIILFIIPVIALGFRRGFLSVVFCAFMLKPEYSMAFEWDSLWLNKEQRSILKYRNGDYKGAELLLKNADDELNLYNKGNILAKQGRYEESILEYNKVLEINPDHEDAKFNLEIVKQALEARSKQEKKDSSPSNSDDNSLNDNKNEQQGKDSSENNSKNESSKDSSLSNSDDNSPNDNKNEQQSKDSSENSSKNESSKDSSPSNSDNNSLNDNKNEQQSKDSSENNSKNESSKDSSLSNSYNDSLNDNKNEQQALGTLEKESELLEKNQSGKGLEDKNNFSIEQDAKIENQEPQTDEHQQSLEQWLRRIPDDPSGLLRRKFKYQYQQRQTKQHRDPKFW